MKISTRNLAALMATACLGLVAANVLLAYALRDTVPKRLYKDIANIHNTKTLAIGNSLIQAGFDADAFSQSTPDDAPAMNVGLGATGLVQWYAIWRHSSDHNPDTRRLIVGISDLIATQTEKPSWKTWHSNESFAFLADPALTKSHATSSPLDEASYLIARNIPLFTERGGPWSKVERLRRYLGALGMNSSNEENNSFGRASDFSMSQDHDLDRFIADIRQATSTGLHLAPPLADIFSEASAKQIKVTVVMMPLRSDRYVFYDNAEWRDYIHRLSKLISSHGVSFIDATQWFHDNSMFADQIHLAPMGAKAFSERLGQELNVSP